MNECFHAKCGERAREAPVCPACKHNNTDVSIHQVDPGKARRDLEKCLSRRHVDRIPLPDSLSLSFSSTFSLSPLSLSFFFSTLLTVFQTRFRSYLLLFDSSRFHHFLLSRPIATSFAKRRVYRVLTSTLTRVVADLRGNEGSHEGHVGPVGGKKCLVVGMRDGIGFDIGHHRLS